MKSKSPFIYSALLLGITASISAPLSAATPVTPIEHVIVVIGENVTFDTLYGTYKPAKGSKSTVFNLLSRKLVNADGTPGSNYSIAQQVQGIPSIQNLYSAKPLLGAPYANLPQPLQTGILDPVFLTFAGGVPDSRFPATLPSGPFPITKYVPYGSANSATGDPVHRFFQMWQQTGGNNSNLGLFTWVAATTGTGGDNGLTGPTPGNAQQGGELMGFYNMSQGDAPLFKSLADNFALSDNYHQAILGGTGANFIAIATAGDVAVYNNAGVLAVPPANQIENPNPKQGTDNFYTQDGYSGGSYVNCSDAKQPGVAAILSRLKSLGSNSNCAPGAYYLVNNYDTPYNVDGTAKTLGATNYVYPPQTVPTIGEALTANSVSWKWYTAGRDKNDVLNDPLYAKIWYLVNLQVPAGTPDRTNKVNEKAYSLTQAAVYNSLGDPLNGSRNVVSSPALRASLQGLDSFNNDVNNGTLPAVSFVVPKNLSSGHPGYSVPALYEQFIGQLVASVQAKPDLWAKTAIIITTDEGGGYFDSGYIQNLDFFGDGPRIPLLVVSPYAKKGYVDHVYHDHASIAKFIEHNWGLSPLSSRSRDNLPNPVAGSNPYLPANKRAIGDLMTMFNF